MFFETFTYTLSTKLLSKLNKIMKRISALSIVLLSFISLVACKEEAISSMPKMEAEIGEAFTITGLTEVNFTKLESTTLTIDFIKFSDHLVKGLVSPRTFVDVAIINGETTTYQIETGYTDTCYGQGDRFCNEISFQVNEQPLLLKFEEIIWGEAKTNSQGTEYRAVESARLIVEID